ncbi:MAG: hypothetical protein KDD36_03840 [Flavobacteriales bacterium]|nr:hypothetical protein [Flavobacteriales bacterium]
MKSKVDTAGEIHKQIEALIDSHRRIAEDNHRLINDINRMEKDLEEKNIRIVELEEQMKMASIAGSISEGGLEQKEVKEKINALVREVDKCISLLNN